MERKLPILAEEVDIVFGNIEQLEQFHRYVNLVRDHLCFDVPLTCA